MTAFGYQNTFNDTLAQEFRRILSVGFSPASIQGMLFWHDAALSPVQISGGKVISWQDLSGQNYHLAEANSSNQPVVLDNALAGKPVISFNGTSSRLATTQKAMFDGRAGFSMFMVANVGNTADFARILTSEDTGTNIIRFALNSGAGRPIRIATQTTSGSLSVTESVSSIGTYRLYQFGYDNTGPGLTLRVDGAAVGANTVTGSPLLATLGTPQSFMVGARSVNGSSFGKVDVAAIIAYGRALTAVERTNVEKYLANRWAITLP